MDRNSSSTRYNDPLWRHKRSASLILPSTPWKDLDQGLPKRLEDFARIDVSSQTIAPDSSPDYILPGIPATERKRPSSLAPSTRSDHARNKRSNRVRPAVWSPDASYEDLHTKRSAEGSARKTLEDEVRDSQFATLPRRSRHQPGTDPLNTSSYRLSNGSIGRPNTSSSDRQAIDAGKTRLSMDLRKRPTKSTNRPTSMLSSLELSGSATQSTPARKLLRLMELTRGSMTGRLFFREDSSDPWAKGHCSINADTGALIARATKAKPFEQRLIENLRGCRVQSVVDSDIASAILVVKPSNAARVIQLRPEDPSEADAWFAALLCWEPVQPVESLSSRTRPQRQGSSAYPADEKYSRSDLRVRKDASIIKVGKVLYMDSNESPSDVIDLEKLHDGISHRTSSVWSRVSCTLRENGELKIYTTTNVSTLATVRLSKLMRSAVQRLNPSNFDIDFCIAIYPEYSDSGDSHSLVRPIYLSFESRVLFEVWFVLLRAFTSPEIYGPGRMYSPASLRFSKTTPGHPSALGPFLFRIERSLHLQVAEARLPVSLNRVEPSNDNGRVTVSENSEARSAHQHVQVLLDRQFKAKTTSKAISTHPFWYEHLDIIDVAPSASSVLVQLRTTKFSNKTGGPRLHKSSRGLLGARRFAQVDITNQIDEIHGDAYINLDDIDPSKESEGWWPLIDESGRAAGEILLKIRMERDIILMDHEYHALSDLLHNYANVLTVQIAEKLPSELSKLSECLLNIFQASGEAGEWLMSLAEEEIDGIRKEAPSGRFTFDGRLEVGDEFTETTGSLGEAGSRASLVRDLTKTAMAEANLLFRGNTLLSKSLDLHMKRLGKDYLEGTIGAKMRAIAEEDPDCEVDPNRITAIANLPQNWHRLLSLTSEVWSLISESALRCPSELRVVFRHIRACTDDRYGERLRSVRYSSVSGFLFLRFFCPAVLNPRLFGLMNNNAGPRTQRTFTLIAKGLQGLANQTLFGVKEPWMEPMNQFLSSHKQQLKDFIDAICSVPSDHQTSLLSPSYSTPLAMFTRLPPASREGFPSLPYLIDSTRNFAVLVNLWLEHFPSGSATPIQSLEPDLVRFHKVCVNLRQRTQDCLTRAERVERRRSSISTKWNAIAERMERKPADFWIQDARSQHFDSSLNGHVDAESTGRQSLSLLSTPGDAISDEGLNGGANGITSRTASSAYLSSTASSDLDLPLQMTKFRPKKAQKDKELTMFGLFGRRRARKDDR